MANDIKTIENPKYAPANSQRLPDEAALEADCLDAPTGVPTSKADSVSEANGRGPVAQETVDLAQREHRHQQIEALSLKSPRSKPKPGGWRRIIGAFDEDPTVEAISEEGRRLRETEPSL